MNTACRVSIVTVCFNCLESLKKTVLSVRQQSFSDFEYVIVDGGSTDGTPQYLASLDNCRWISERDNGIYDAMNKAVSLSHGDYVIFMNAGDVFASPDVLASVFASPRSADVVYGDVIKVVNDRPRLKKAEAPHNAHRMFFCHQCAFTRRDTLLAFPFDTSYRLSADFKLYKLLWKDNRTFERVDTPVAVFDTNGLSNVRRLDGLKENIAVIKQVDDLSSRLRLLPHLYFTCFVLRLRQLFK